jgi:hypothetical protein
MLSRHRRSIGGFAIGSNDNRVVQAYPSALPAAACMLMIYRPTLFLTNCAQLFARPGFLGGVKCV